MAPGTFSSSNSGPIWKRFMKEGHALLNVAPRPFEKPPDVTTRKCGSINELFKDSQKPAKPGACNPGSDSGSERTPAPAEETVVPTPELTPVQTATPTAKPTAAPSATPEATPTPEVVPSETPTLVPTPLLVPGGGPGP
jgi:membrane peptidoglycan carboxypeptidase